MTETPEEHPGTPSVPITVPCPTCGQPALFARSNRYRPFCSERCKQIDLGAWAAEDFRVPTEAPPDDAPYGDPKTQP